MNAIDFDCTGDYLWAGEPFNRHFLILWREDGKYVLLTSHELIKGINNIARQSQSVLRRSDDIKYVKAEDGPAKKI